MNPDFLLELLNGCGAVLDAIFIYWLVRYLIRETRRREIPLRDWISRIPPSMHFATAIVIHDIGVFIRAATLWSWRRFHGAGNIDLPILVLLAIGAIFIAVGAICKIRAVSHPDYGDSPWLFAIAAAAIFLTLSVVFR